MFTRALLATVIGFTLVESSQAQPTHTRKPGSSDTWSVYENVNTGPMRTTLSRENKYPEVGQFELGGFYENAEKDELEQDIYGVYGRVGLWEFVTAEAVVPVVDAEFEDESNNGIGDVVLKLDLLAFQDIFRYPFFIPHIDVSLPTGDEDDGLGTGETGVTIGMSIGTKVYDMLTYVIDIAYAMNNGDDTSFDDDDIFYVSGSLVWDVSDRFALLTEGRIYEENSYENYPYIIKGGAAYRVTPDVQIAGYGGVVQNDIETDDSSYNTVSVRLSVQF